MKPLVKIQDVRSAAKLRGIRSITHLAALVPCSRQAIYFALEKPARFPTVSRRIKELIK